jgi:hypothetical protein
MRRGSRKRGSSSLFPQLDRTGARFPHPVAVAVALIDPIGVTSAMRGACQALDLRLHQALRGKAHHFAQQVASELFSENVRRFIMSSVIVGPWFVLSLATNPTENRLTTTLRSAGQLRRGCTLSFAHASVSGCSPI